MSLQRRRERYIIIQMWKILNEVCPNDVGVEFRAESRFGVQAVVPSLVRRSSQANQSLYDRSFAVVGPKLWNLLPANISVLSSASQFKTRLTQYLVGLPDEPPVAGVAKRHNNSLPEVVGLAR